MFIPTCILYCDYSRLHVLHMGLKWCFWTVSLPGDREMLTAHFSYHLTIWP